MINIKSLAIFLKVPMSDRDHISDQWWEGSFYYERVKYQALRYSELILKHYIL